MADYEKMWEDLGMDVKNHDNLCQVLPTAVGDVFMTQENRPKAMDFWDMVIAEVHGIRPAELIEEQKKGRKVFGTFCVYVPDEVIIAANGIVTGLCGFPSVDYAAHTIVLHLEVYGCQRFELGYSSTIAVVLFVVMIGANALIKKMLSKVGT